MVLVEMNPQEVKALDELMKDAKCPIQMGLILGLFRTKIQEAFNKDMKKRQKEQARVILGVKKDKDRKA